MNTRPGLFKLSARKRNLLIIQIVLALFSLFWIAPTVWGFMVSLRPPNEPIGSGRIWFGSTLTLENYVTAFEIAPFGQYYINTIIMVFGILAVQLVTITLAAYAFARYDFPGKNALFFLVLLQMLVPTTALIVPNYATIRNIGLFDTRMAMMLPYFGSAFGTFLLMQTFRTIPGDLVDAAQIDGANWFRVLLSVYLPAGGPAYVAFGLSSISSHWNEFLWPLVVTNSEASRPLTVGLAVFTQMGELGAQWPLVTAATFIVIGPLFILFLIFQKQFINSFIRSGLK